MSCFDEKFVHALLVICVAKKNLSECNIGADVFNFIKGRYTILSVSQLVNLKLPLFFLLIIELLMVRTGQDMNRVIKLENYVKSLKEKSKNN
jgi:hypothetical protein